MRDALYPTSDSADDRLFQCADQRGQNTRAARVQARMREPGSTRPPSCVAFSSQARGSAARASVVQRRRSPPSPGCSARTRAGRKPQRDDLEKSGATLASDNCGPSSGRHGSPPTPARPTPTSQPVGGHEQTGRCRPDPPMSNAPPDDAPIATGAQPPATDLSCHGPHDWRRRLDLADRNHVTTNERHGPHSAARSPALTTQPTERRASSR
jgi:hypothetical protein